MPESRALGNVFGDASSQAFITTEFGGKGRPGGRGQRKDRVRVGGL